MTNGDWIRGMTDEELEEKVFNVCNHFSCGKCPIRNARGKCALNTDEDITMAWLESEHEEREVRGRR